MELAVMVMAEAGEKAPVRSVKDFMDLIIFVLPGKPSFFVEGRPFPPKTENWPLFT